MSETFDPFAALGATAAPAQAPAASPATPAAPAAAAPFDPFAALGAVSQPGTPEPPAGRKTGYLANIAAGVVEGASGALNFMTDPIGQTGNMIGTLGVAAYDAITRQFGGEGVDPKLRQALFGDDGTGAGTKLAETVRLATGAPKLEDVVAATPGEGLARGGAAGAAGMVPFATGGVGRAAGAVAAGAAGGVVGKGLSEAVPERYADAANLIGNFAGTIGAQALGTAASEAGRGAARTFREARQPFAGKDEPFADPRTGEPFRDTQTGDPVMATAGQADLAATRLREAAGAKPGTDVAAIIPEPAQQQIVPGSQPTVGQATGNTGLLRLERDQRTRAPDAFGAAEAANQVARVAALRSMADPQATGVAAGEFARDHLAAIREHEANLDRLTLGYAQQAAQRVGPGPGQTSEQAVGTSQQQALEALRGPLKAARSALYDAVDPSGTKMVDVTTVGDTARRLQAELNTDVTGLAAGPEGRSLEALARWRGEVTFADLRRADTALSDVMRDMVKAGQVETSPWRRAQLLRNAIDEALQGEVARAAAADVGAGAAGGTPGNLSTVGQRLAALQERVLQSEAGGQGAGGPTGAGPAAAAGGQGGAPASGGAAGPGAGGPGGVAPSGGVATGPTDVGPRFSRSGERGENALVPKPEAVMAAIDVANRITGGKALVQAHDPESGVFTVRFADGSTERVNGYAIGSLIQVAMDPTMLETVGHEAVHVVRNLGLITPAEWRKLSDMVLRDDLIGKYRLEENYPNLRGDDLIEEAVAEHAAQAVRKAAGKPVQGLIGRFIDAVKRFGARVRSALTGMGWRSPEDVFADLTGGKMGQREVGAGAPTRGPVGARASQEAAVRWARDSGQPAEPAAPRYSNEPRFSRSGTPPDAGAPGIPGTDLPPASGQPFTAADRAALRTANAAYRDYKLAYRDGVIGQVLQRGNLPTGFKVPAEAVPALLFRQGTQGATAMAALLRATTLARDGDAMAGAMLARQILGDAPAFSFRRAAERNGVIVPALAEKWLADHRPLLDLDTVTGLRDQFATAADATRTLEEVRARGEANIVAAQQSALRHLLTKDGQPVEPSVAITNLLRSPRAIEDAKALMQQLAPSPAAVDGLRSELVEHLVRQTQSAAEAGTTGVSEIKGATFQRMVNDPRTSGVIRTVLGATGLELVKRIADDIQRFGRSVNATKVPGSPGTAMDYFAALKGDGKPYASLIGQLAVAQAVGYLGMAAAGGSGLHGVAGGTLLATAKIVYDAMRRRGFERVDQLVNQAILQPELARVLLSREPLEPGTPAMKRFLSALSGVVPATSASHYADEQRRKREGSASPAAARAH